MPLALEQIKHIVVLMMENRSFDHMLGYLRSDAYPIEGLTGAEFNAEDPSADPPQKVFVSNDAAYIHDLQIDPGHQVTDVNVQIFGNGQGTSSDIGHNIGFILDYSRQKGSGPQQASHIMKCFAPGRLPVLATLAREYALCDHWFASVPGPTWPNRFFAHCATSGGHIDNKLRNYDMRTIYQNLSDAGIEWRVYFHDIPQSLALAHLRIDILKDRFQDFDDFLSAAKSGSLPAYSFLEPRYNNFLFKKANDQHPDHDVSLGEDLIADVYEAIRNSPSWEQTLLVVLYDEHGGIFDHVTPPAAVNPDGLNYSSPDLQFNFDRLGIRVPAVLIAPFIPKGTIDSTVYDHTSIPALLKKRFHLPNFLTKRDAAANTFEGVLKLETPRTDTPDKLTRPGNVLSRLLARARITPNLVAAAVAEGHASRQPLSEWQQSLVDLSNILDAGDNPVYEALRMSRTIDCEHDAAVHVREATCRFLGR